MKNYLSSVLFFCSLSFSQEIIIGVGTAGQPLLDYVILNYKSSSTLGYNNARDVMYSIIDLEDDNSLKGIYTNYTIFIDPAQDPRPQTNAFNMNCEHSWPQSMGAGSEPQKSDLHHLYPARGNVNSSRGNKHFADIDDNDTDKWWRFDYYETSIPNEFIDEFSEVDNGNGVFEPREDVKGNIARSMFYFYTMYNDVADTNFFNIQKETLYDWHRQDPVDANELNRTLAIAGYQENKPNPYVVDSTLVRRIWFEEESKSTWYISIDGSDNTGDGSEQNPFATIQNGVDSANDNDTIFVSAGLYFENINWSMANNIRLIGSHMDSTVIDGEGVGKVIDNSDETAHPIEISNLTIQNGYSTGKGGGISLKMVGDILLKNIKVDNNQARNGAGIYIEGEGSASSIPTTLNIENSVISNNSATTYGGGISLSGAIISSIMKNVTVVNNSAVDGGGGISAGSMGDYAIVVNSIFWNNQPTNADGMIFPYYSNIDIPIGINNLYTDPLFVEGDTNFNLSDSSPCIDAGTNFLVVDLSNQMLPGPVPDTLVNLSPDSYIGIKPDMGAFESAFISVESCIANDGTVGVELWGECYSIDETTNITLSGNPVSGILDLGVIPAQIGNLINLDTLSCQFCGFSGSIPPEIGNLINLKSLSIVFSGLTGSIPSEIGNLSNLESLTLHSNQLTGAIPPEIGSLTNLTKLQLSYNQLTGSLPPELGNLNDLIHLYLNNYENSPGELTGSIPPEFGNLINLERMDLSNHQLTGSIPPEFGNLINLERMVLSNNLFSGSIPPEIGNLTSLSILHLNENSLSGELPSEIYNLINLSGGHSSGAGPLGWTNGLDVSRNLLSGEISSAIGNLINVVSMNFSQNQFTGSIPAEIGNLNNLWGLALDSNQLSGLIPIELWDQLNYIEILDLSFNQFSGGIPENICSMSIPGVTFDISNNQLCPPYPSCIEDHIGEQDTLACIPSWNFSISEPSIQISGDDNDWNPGESLQIEMDFCNNSDIAHGWYPGLVLEADTNLVSISNDHFWFFGMPGNSCNMVPFDILADSTINFDTLVTFIAYAEALNCQNQPEYCIFGDTLTFQVSLLGEDVLSAQELDMPMAFSLHQNYPNPFNPITLLRYDLPNDGLVNITIYDMMGRIVKTLVNGSQTAGFKTIQWNATNNKNEPVPAGLYLYTIQTEEFRQAKKMVLLK